MVPGEVDERDIRVTAGLSDTDAAQLLRGGVAGIFTKHSFPELLAKCVRRVIQGEPWIDDRYSNVLARVPEADREGGKPTFTERERAILRACLKVWQTKKLPSRLNVSQTSVKALLQQLFEKTGVRTRGRSYESHQSNTATNCKQLETDNPAKFPGVTWVDSRTKNC